jgi:hypothetical protein
MRIRDGNSLNCILPRSSFDGLQMFWGICGLAPLFLFDVKSFLQISLGRGRLWAPGGVRQIENGVYI